MTTRIKKLYYMNKDFAKGAMVGLMKEEIIDVLENDRLDGNKLYEERYKDSIESITSKIVDEEWIDG